MRMYPAESHVVHKVLEPSVLLARELVCDGAEVHWLLDQTRVVVQPHLLPLDRLGEVHCLVALEDVFHECVALPLHGHIHRVQEVGCRLRPLVPVPRRSALRRHRALPGARPASAPLLNKRALSAQP